VFEDKPFLRFEGLSFGSKQIAFKTPF